MEVSAGLVTTVTERTVRAFECVVGKQGDMLKPLVEPCISINKVWSKQHDGAERGV